MFREVATRKTIVSKETKLRKLKIFATPEPVYDTHTNFGCFSHFFPNFDEIMLSLNSNIPPFTPETNLEPFQRYLWFSFCCYLFVSESHFSLSSSLVVNILDLVSLICGESLRYFRYRIRSSSFVEQ